MSTTDTTRYARAVADAIFQLERGYSLAALAALRAVARTEDPPAVPPMERSGRDA